MDESLSLENTLWHNTILASGEVIAIVIYSGKDTRASMNQSASKTKFGIFDREVNYFSKVCQVYMVIHELMHFKAAGFHDGRYISTTCLS